MSAADRLLSPLKPVATRSQPLGVDPWRSFAKDFVVNETVLVLANTAAAFALNYFKGTQIDLKGAALGGVFYTATYMGISEAGRLYTGTTIRGSFSLSPLKLGCLVFSLIATPVLTYSSTYWLQRQITAYPASLFSGLDTTLLTLMQLWC